MSAARFAFAGRALLDTNPESLTADLVESRPDIPEADALLASLSGDPEQLEAEYVRLFLNPAGAPCSPWQSAHEDEGRLMGAAHQSAMAWYSSFGAVPSKESEPADHAGLLLMFYAQLLVSDASEELLARFAERHLMWIKNLATCIGSQTRHPFYGALASMLTATIAQIPVR